MTKHNLEKWVSEEYDDYTSGQRVTKKRVRIEATLKRNTTYAVCKDAKIKEEANKHPKGTFFKIVNTV